MISGLLTMLVAAAVPCMTARPEACADTNALVLSPDFRPRLTSFLGRSRGSYLDRDGPVIDQAIEVLHGPPDPPRRLADGSWLFTACRAHSCPEKGAIALSDTGRVLAFGILSFDCHRGPAGTPACADAPSLTLFIPREVARSTTAYTDAIIRWARDAANEDASLPGSVAGKPFRGVVTRLVSGGTGSSIQSGRVPARRR